MSQHIQICAPSAPQLFGGNMCFMCGCADHVVGIDLRPVPLKELDQTLNKDLNDIIES